MEPSETAGSIESGPTPADGPRFCPRCDQEAAATAGELCRDCGDRLIPQGYCPVCEAFWRLPADAPCPKHDLPLVPAPAARPTFPPGTRWVTVRTFEDALDAEAPRLRLEAEGIPTFLEGARMSSRSMYHVATGGTKLQVPEPLAADARVLLDQTWEAPTPPDDHDDAWDELAPEPGAGRRRVMRGLILVMLFGPLILTLLAVLMSG